MGCLWSKLYRVRLFPYRTAFSNKTSGDKQNCFPIFWSVYVALHVRFLHQDTIWPHVLSSGTCISSKTSRFGMILQIHSTNQAVYWNMRSLLAASFTVSCCCYRVSMCSSMGCCWQAGKDKATLVLTCQQEYSEFSLALWYGSARVTQCSPVVREFSYWYFKR